MHRVPSWIVSDLYVCRFKQYPHNSIPMLESTVSSCSETIPGLPHTIDAASLLHYQGSPPASCGRCFVFVHVVRNNGTFWK
eukprot:UN2729